jgi:S-adenosylmethionine hydrolase
MIGMVRLAVPEPEPAPGIVRGIVLLIDEPYGNVWTNMRREDLLAALGRVPARLRVRMAGRNFRVPLARTFGDVPEGMDLAYFNSRDQLSFAVNLGSFAATYGVEVDDLVEVASGE